MTYGPQGQYPQHGQGQQPQYPQYGQQGYPGQPPYGYPAQPGYYAGMPPTAQSGAGIASLILGLLMGVTTMITVVMAGAMAMNAPGGQLSETDPKVQAIGCVTIVGLLGCLVGLICGIVGAVQKDRKKGLAIAGLIINGLVLLGVGGLMLAGTAMR